MAKEHFEPASRKEEFVFNYIVDFTEADFAATTLTYADGTVRNEISQGRIGTKLIPGMPSAKYLYDSYAYDSPLEKDNIMAEMEAVIVYGKIPRSSIAIPTITGGMHSPDFMYVVRRADGSREFNLGNKQMIQIINEIMGK